MPRISGLGTDVILQNLVNLKLAAWETIGLFAMLYVLTIFSPITKGVLASLGLTVSVFIRIMNYTEPHLLETRFVIFKFLFNLYYMLNN